MAEKTKAAAMPTTGQTPMVKRVAMAISPLTWRTDINARPAIMQQARAAIEAMREPTDAMKVAGGIAWEDEFFGQHGIIFDAAGRAWTAQVTAALSEADHG